MRCYQQLSPKEKELAFKAARQKVIKRVLGDRLFAIDHTPIEETVIAGRMDELSCEQIRRRIKAKHSADLAALALELATAAYYPNAEEETLRLYPRPMGYAGLGRD